MKFLIPLLILIGSAFLFQNCGESESTSEPQKTIASSWTETESGSVFNFEEVKLGEESFLAFSFDNGAICTCTSTLVGTDTRGTFSYYSCTHNPDSGSGDPGCSTISRNGTYEIENNTLTACGQDSNGGGNQNCATFR